jgi:hypothetical protein
MFAGNRDTASFAVPSKIITGVVIFSRSIFDVSKNFAPLSDLGCLVVVRVMDSSKEETDFIASSPPIAPDGR